MSLHSLVRLLGTASRPSNRIIAARRQADRVKADPLKNHVIFPVEEDKLGPHISTKYVLIIRSYILFLPLLDFQEEGAAPGVLPGALRSGILSTDVYRSHSFPRFDTVISSLSTCYITMTHNRDLFSHPVLQASLPAPGSILPQCVFCSTPQDDLLRAWIELQWTKKQNEAHVSIPPLDSSLEQNRSCPSDPLLSTLKAGIWTT